MNNDNSESKRGAAAPHAALSDGLMNNTMTCRVKRGELRHAPAKPQIEPSQTTKEPKK